MTFVNFGELESEIQSIADALFIYNQQAEEFLQYEFEQEAYLASLRDEDSFSPKEHLNEN